MSEGPHRPSDTISRAPSGQATSEDSNRNLDPTEDVLRKRPYDMTESSDRPSKSRKNHINQSPNSGITLSQDPRHDEGSSESKEDQSLASPTKQSTSTIPSSTINEKTGLSFPVTLSTRALRSGNYSEKVAPGASVYLTAVMEYLATEILDLAGNIAQDEEVNEQIVKQVGGGETAAKKLKGRTITPQHLQFILGNDDELRKVVEKISDDKEELETEVEEEDEDEDEDEDEEDDAPGEGGETETGEIDEEEGLEGEDEDEGIVEEDEEEGEDEIETDQTAGNGKQTGGNKGRKKPS